MNRAAGPFEILEILGEGSFGTVCVARVTGDPLRRKVALKILKGAYARNDKILNRTRDEARLLSRISHPNIVRVERLMDVGGRPVVVMEHVQGVSLDALLLRFKDGLVGSVALELTRQACLALHVAYNETAADDGRPLRVIHRDMKPSNVMLSIHGEVKVVDFGIAKGEFDGREAQTESVVMGSRPYMAPERLDGISDSPSVDVYSAGMSLFELLTGRTMSLSINPITHDQAMNRQLGYLNVPGMSQAALEDLRAVIRKMCAYDRDYRPTALDAARDLEQCLYAIDPSHRIGLVEFARTTVLPIYESRPKISPDDAGRDDDDGNFLREVTGQLTNPTGTHMRPVRSPLAEWAPYVFVGALTFMVLMLGALAMLKLVTDQRAGATQGVIAPPQPVVSVEPPDGKVRVKLVFPSDADALVDDTLLRTRGHVNVYPGPNVAQLMFDSGQVLDCTFTVAEDGMAVRYVVEQGQGALSVDDGTPKACTVTKAATPTE
ncbi:MAG: serine/threonine protein kinase [Proteobacteria bacterium]|nr:serine/threonine protein kinase [Pseudomonadota bacterium]